MDRDRDITDLHTDAIMQRFKARVAARLADATSALVMLGVDRGELKKAKDSDGYLQKRTAERAALERKHPGTPDAIASWREKHFGRAGGDQNVGPVADGIRDRRGPTFGKRVVPVKGVK